MPCSLHVYTAQLGAYQGPDALDLSVPNTHGPARLFAFTEKAERHAYLAFLRQSYRARRVDWTTLLSQPRLVLLCSCPPGTHTCHRYVVAEVLHTLGATLGGEVRTAPLAPQRSLKSFLRTQRRR